MPLPPLHPLVHRTGTFLAETASAQWNYRYRIFVHTVLTVVSNATAVVRDVWSDLRQKTLDRALAYANPYLEASLGHARTHLCALRCPSTACSYGVSGERWLPLCLDYPPWTGSDIGILLVALLVTLILAVVPYVLCAWAPWRNLSSRLVSFWSRRITGWGSVRTRFMSMAFPRPHAVRNHTHGAAAADRSAATVFCTTVAAQLGRRPYIEQMSATNQRNALPGNRTYFWAKDHAAEPTQDRRTEGDLNIIVDTDYYVDMNAYLAGFDVFSGTTRWSRRPIVPILLYTFTPSQAARATGEYSYTFQPDGSVKHSISGGAEYSHHLWDYSGDSLCVATFFHTVIYQIERRSTDDDHSLILLTPLRIVFLPLSWFPRLYAAPRVLARFNPIVYAAGKRFVRFDVQTQNGRIRTTGRPGEYNCATVPAARDDALAAISMNLKQDLTMGQVEMETGLDKGQSALLTLYHRFRVPTPPPTTFTVDVAAHAYEYVGTGYDPDAKPLMQAYMSPIIDVTYVPVGSVNNEAQAIQRRLLDFQHDADDQVDSRLLVAITEFCTLVLGDSKNKLVPVDPDEVSARQPRPSQQAILEGADGGSKHNFGSFLKAEKYSEPKDPRLITTMPGDVKMLYSRYLYAVGDFLTTKPWYAFGKTPREIAERVVVLARGATTMSSTDASRMDGHIRTVARLIEATFLAMAFAGEHAAAAVNAHANQVGLKAYTKHDLSYWLFLGRGSGSPETAAFNTLVTAFIDFFSRILSGHSPQVAYAMLGVYGGDDGLTADPNVPAFELAAELVGQSMEIELIPRGASGVNFLARFYGPAVWFGEPDSICDVPRTLSGLHMTVALPPNVTPEMKLAQKLVSLSYTDAHTPIIEPLILAAKNLAPDALRPDPDLLKYLGSFWGQTPDDQWPNSGGDWCYDYVASWLPDFNVERFAEALANAQTFSDLLRLPLCAEPLDKFKPHGKGDPYMVDGQLVGKVPEQILRPQQRVARPRPKNLRMDFLSAFEAPTKDGVVTLTAKQTRRRARRSK